MQIASSIINAGVDYGLVGLSQQGAGLVYYSITVQPFAGAHIATNALAQHVFPKIGAEFYERNCGYISQLTFCVIDLGILAASAYLFSIPMLTAFTAHVASMALLFGLCYFYGEES